MIIPQRRVELSDLELLNELELQHAYPNPKEDFELLSLERGEKFTNFISAQDLNPWEALSISMYADFLATSTNDVLCKIEKKPRDEGHLFYGYLLKKSLRKLPSFDYRTVFTMFSLSRSGARDKEEFYSWFEKRLNDGIQFPNFLGASRRKWPDHGLYLQIRTSSQSNARHIEPLTNKPFEDEVTFLPNATFTIEGVSRSEQTIYLLEKSCTQKADYVLKECFVLNYRDKDGEEEIEEEDTKIQYFDWSKFDLLEDE